MLGIPIRFPSEVERLRKAIEADRALNFQQRIQALDGIWNTIDLFTSTAKDLPARQKLRQLREEEGHACFREFIQRQLANQPADVRETD
jgi:hypothetical protein